MDQKKDRSVSTADALQSLAMKFSLASAPWNPLPLGGYTGTGMRPKRTQAKKTQIISRPGGYTKRTLSQGFKAAIVRTKKGLDLINSAVKAGFIHIGDQLKIEDIDDFQPHQVNKKKAVYARHLGMAKNNVPTINTKGLRIKELYKLNSEDFNKKEELGVSKRLKKI